MSRKSGERKLTVDELARRTGMTVRNIRAHQSRGLLPAPEVRGRTGYYGREHVDRIALIRELQDEGFNLEAIRRLLESAQGSSSEVLKFTRAVREPFESEEPKLMSLEALASRWGEFASPELLARAIDSGFLRPVDDAHFEERSPRLGAVGQELASLGIEPDVALDVLGELRDHSEVIARRYVQLFLEEVWEPFAAEGHPEARWPEVREAFERLRPLAGESVLAVFLLAMTDATEEALGRALSDMPQDTAS